MARPLSRVLAFVAAAACLPGCVPYVRTYAPPVSGQVFDARSRRPASGVRVYTTNHQQVAAETRSARDGSFELPAKTGLALYFPGQAAFPLPRLVVEPAAQSPRELTVEYEPTWLPLDNASRRQAPSDVGLRPPRGR